MGTATASDHGDDVYIYTIYTHIHTQYVRDDIQATSRWFERFTTCHEPSVCKLFFVGVKPAVKKTWTQHPRCHGAIFKLTCCDLLPGVNGNAGSPG